MIRLTAGEALAGSRAAARSLSALGLRPGSRVALCIPTSKRSESSLVQALTLQVVWAAVRCGITPVLINPALPSIERSVLLADSESSLEITTTNQLVDLVNGNSAASPYDTGTFTARPMHYTSGTTGRSKGVWTGFLAASMLNEWWTDEQDQWGFDAADVTLVHGPLSSSAPLRHSLLVLAAGGDVLLPGSFDPNIIAKSLSDDRPTTAFTVPSHWQRLFTLADLPKSTYRLLAHAGSECPSDLKRKLHSWAGTEATWEFYGSTEGQFTICAGSEWEARPGTLGTARGNRRLYVDDGIIWCETPPNSRFEYWRDEEKTRRAWRVHTDGTIAFTVGDLGRIDAQGYLYLDGRREDLIISGGMNVYPAQVEAALNSLPGVTECAVFGVPNDKWGQSVCAVIVGDITDETIHRLLRPRLAGYQRPKQVYRLAQIPRNAMGKIQRLDLPRLLSL